MRRFRRTYTGFEPPGDNILFFCWGINPCNGLQDFNFLPTSFYELQASLLGLVSNMRPRGAESIRTARCLVIYQYHILGRCGMHTPNTMKSILQFILFSAWLIYHSHQRHRDHREPQVPSSSALRPHLFSAILTRPSSFA